MKFILKHLMLIKTSNKKGTGIAYQTRKVMKNSLYTNRFIYTLKKKLMQLFTKK